MAEEVARLQQEVQETEYRLHALRDQLQQAEQLLQSRHQKSDEQTVRATDGRVANASADAKVNGPSERRRWPLEDDEYKRYGRQLIMPQIGIEGQLSLKNAKVLIVGMGGLGCPAAAYLAGAGVGTLGLMDGDTVELSNLHRQMAHSTARIGMSKVDSAYEYLHSYVANRKVFTASSSDHTSFVRLNPSISYQRHRHHLTSETAVSIFSQFDMVLDCTDHPTSRYLISDACVLTSKPLVSASALRTEGQLLVLNNPPRLPGDASGGPCYRCIFPKPPPAESVLSCGEGGILGPVVGLMGVLQALEAIKLLVAKPKRPDEESPLGDVVPEEPPRPSMLMFSAYSNPQFRTVRLRARRKKCAVCSSTPSITKESLTSGSLDYVAFCGTTTPVNILSNEHRVSVEGFVNALENQSNVVIDVRDETQFAICALPNSVNVPWTGDTKSWLEKARDMSLLEQDNRARYVVCRLGNDSQLATKAMMDAAGVSSAMDVRGGFRSWRERVDPDWPDY